MPRTNWKKVLNQGRPPQPAHRNQPTTSQATEEPMKQFKDSDFEMFEQKHSKSSAHHCLFKDAGTTHGLVKACFKKGHMGICPKCNHACSGRHGCDQCNVSGRDLYSWDERAAIVKENRRLKDLAEANANKNANGEGDGNKKANDNNSSNFRRQG